MNNETASPNKGYTIGLGILLIIFGLIVLGAQVFTTFLSIFFLGWMLILGGLAQFFYGFFSGSWTNFFLSLIGGIVSFIFGLIIVLNPEASAASLTLLIGILLLISGIYKILASVFVQYEQWGWSLFTGIIIFLLGVSILTRWPFSGLWVIGLFIGIELLATGFMLTTIAYQPTEELTPRETSYMAGVKGGSRKKNKNNK